MDPVTVYKATSMAVGAASELMAVIDEAKDRKINSLSEYTKRTLLSSRVYVEDVIANEPIIPGLLKLINTMYASMCMVALRLNDIVTGGHTVRNMLGVVSTEEFHLAVDLIKDQFGDKKVTVKDATPSVEDNGPNVTVGTDIRTVSVPADASHLFTGRLMQIDIGSGPNKASIYFIVQLMPYIVPTITMEEYLKLNSSPSKALRRAQYKAGEIRYWKDFVFECDRVEKRRKALRADKDGILREMEDSRTHGLWRSIKNWFGSKNAVVNRNVANAIVVCTKSTLDRATRELGLNVRNFNDRQKIMAGTMSLLIAAYDPNYGTIDLYLNGIRNRAEYSDQMVQSFVKKDNAGQIDLKQLLPLIAAGNAQIRF